MNVLRNNIPDNSGKEIYEDHEQLFNKKIWSIKDVSTFTGLKVGSIYNRTSKGLIPFSKRGSRLFFNPYDILNWIDEGGR
ncbi:MAG: helix-turn-helix domain-containing protein [Bacteriovoracaceae bacterium]|nr:helix-turn-helix domain-containing protein [Bacteriovoracaceae bacterium]